MKFLEKDLEEVIFNASYEDLQDRGLDYVYPMRKRQLKIGNYGIADIVSMQHWKDWDYNENLNKYELVNTGINISIVELKLDNISISSFLQGLRYAKGVARYVEKRGIFRRYPVLYQLTIIGRSIDLQSDLVYLPEFMECDLKLSLMTYDFDLKNGLTFTTHEGYVLSDEGFKFPRQ